MHTLKTIFAAFGAALVVAGPAHSQLPVEPIPSVESLPKKYPEHWVFAHDMAFFGLLSGRVNIIDPTAENHDMLGMVSAMSFASFAASNDRGELYVAETFYSRGTRGERSDFLTIYDAATLDITAQIELPGAKRSATVTQKGALQITRDGSFILAFNFTPAASVTVVDLNQRAVVNEIQVPGCMMIYPSGDRGFASLCGDGAMIAFDLDEAGQPVGEFRTAKFNDMDADPMFTKVAYIGDTAYFPTFKGYVQPVTLGGGEPVIGERVYLAGSVRDSKHGAFARPSGWQVITADDRGRVYILMRPNAGVGDHKSGGSYVWVYDPKKESVIDEIALTGNSISIEATSGRSPMLVAANEMFNLDVYDARKGDHIRYIGGWPAGTPFGLYAVN